MDDVDQDVYVAQLKEVFDSCDVFRAGRLGRNQLIQLCHKLQLDDETDNLLEQLLGDDPDARVDFEEFKEGFVLVLSNAVEEIESELESDLEEDYSVASSNPGNAVHDGEDGGDEEDAVFEEPKYVKDGKRYGRRSKPDFTESENEYNTTEYSDTDTSYQSPRHTPRSTGHAQRLSSIGSVESFDHDSKADDDHDSKADDDHDSKADDGHDSDRSSVGSGKEPLNETFEAEGQLNPSMSLLEVTSPTDEVQVKAIWDEVGVGQNGFLKLNELQIVCEHIGMEEMNDEEMTNLFEKLDVDKDGQVSFEEFVHGLFIHGSASGLALSPSLHLMSPAQKVKLRMALGSSMEDPLRTATPSYLTSGHGTTLLSMLDTDNTGFVQTEAVAQQWESQGIHNPQEVLEAIEVDMESGKINIQDLSTALEHVLLTTGDDNGVYQAALTTYQTELKHLKSQLDNVSGEREKLKQDLVEANLRNATLVQEVDDRHANIEKNMETRLIEAEKKHQDKVNTLQIDLDREREMLSLQASKQKQQLEEIIEQLRSEEALLKEKLTLAQKENSRLEREVVETAEQLDEYEKTNQKLQRDLEDYNELQQRLAEMEAQEDHINEKHVQFYQQNLKEYQEQNRYLRDENDELLQQIQLLQQQLSERKLRRRGSRSRDLNQPNRNGSVLSDYAKPVVIRRRDTMSSSEDQSEGDDASAISSGKRKQPPLALTVRPGGDGGSAEDEDHSNKQQDDLAKHAEEIAQLKRAHSEEINEMRHNIERERKDIEQAYKMEITDLEDSIQLEKESFMKQKDSWIASLEEKEKFAKEEKDDRERKFRKEILHMREEFDREKMELLQKFAREKSDLRDKLEAEYNDDLDLKIKDVKEKLLRDKAELEDRYTREKLDIGQGYAKDKTQTEIEFKRAKSNLELQYTEEKSQLVQQHEQEKAELERMYKKQVAELEQIFVEGEAGLKGQLRADFNELLEKHKQELEASFGKEKYEIQAAFDREKEELERELDMEKAGWSKNNQEDRKNIEEKLRKEYEMEKRSLEKKLSQKIKRETEDAFVDQVERIKEAHEEDKEDMKKENQSLQDKLNQTLLKVEQSEKRLKAMEVEREDTVSMMKTQTVQAAQQRSTFDKFLPFFKSEQPSSQASDQNVESTAAYEELESQKSLLELKVRALEQKLKTRSQPEGIGKGVQATASMTTKITQTAEERRNNSTQTERNVQSRAQQTLMEGVRPESKTKSTQIYSKDTYSKGVQFPEAEGKGWFHWLMKKEEKIANQAVQATVTSQNKSVQAVDDVIKTRVIATQTIQLEQSVIKKAVTTQTEYKTVNECVQTTRDLIKSVNEIVQTDKDLIEGVDKTVQTDKDLIQSLVAESVHTTTKALTEAKVEMLEEERAALKRDLKSVNQKLLETRTAVSLAQSQHMREIQRLREQKSEITEKELLTLNSKLSERESRLRELEKTISEKEEDINGVLNRVKVQYDAKMKSLKEERAELDKKHRTARGLLDDNVIRLKEQYNKSAKRDMLLKELYIENAELMKALAETEEREKTAERAVYQLADKNKALTRVLRKVCPAAL
ncbi:uncharacterized protein LOC144451668 isoform X3 [Glandiceps talaboti]